MRKLLIAVVGLFIVGQAFAKSTPPADPESDLLYTPEMIQKQFNPEQESFDIIQRKTGGVVPKIGNVQVQRQLYQRPTYYEKEIIKFKLPKYKMPSYQLVSGKPFEPKPYVEKNAQQTSSLNYQTVSQNTTQTQQTGQNSYFFQAYCSAVQDYKVSVFPIPAEFDCLIKKQDGTTEVKRIVGQLIPDLKSFSLLFQPTRIPGCPSFKITMVMNSQKNSYSIADRVDKKTIANILVRSFQETAKDTGDVLKKALLESGKVVTVSSTGTTVENEDKLKKIPKYAKYSFLANLVGNTADVIASSGSLKPLFEIYKGSEIYMEGICEVNK